MTPSYLRGRVEGDVPTRFLGLARVHAYGFGARLGVDRGGVLGTAARTSTDVPRVPSPAAAEVLTRFLRRAEAARVNGDVAYVCAPIPVVSCNESAHWSRRDRSDATQVVPFVRDTKVVVFGRDVDEGAWRCDHGDGRAQECNALAGGDTASVSAGSPGVPSRMAPMTWNGSDQVLRTDVDGQAKSRVVLAWPARVVFDGATESGPAKYLGRALLVVENPQPRKPPGGVHVSAHNRDARHTLPFIETGPGIVSGLGIDVRSADTRPASLTGPHFARRLTLVEGSPAPLISHLIFVNGRFVPNLFLAYDEGNRIDRVDYAGVPGLADLLAGLDGVRVLFWRKGD